MNLVRQVAVCLLLCAVFGAVADAQFAPYSLPPTPTAVSAPDSLPPTPTALERLTREVSLELRCPVCQGESIQESPAELAQEMKALVREQLAAGRTPDEVKAYFVARYGEWILLRPTTTGVNAALYWLPPVVLVAGGATVIFLARRWRRASRLAASTTPPDSSDA